MIDTVKIAVDEKNYKIKSYKYLRQKNISEGDCWGNTTIFSGYAKEMKDKGIYAPDFEIGDHSSRANKLLRITASLPKLIKGSNLYELSFGQLDAVCSEIEKHMKNAGIIPVDLNLKNCIIEQIDYSKNIALPDWCGTAEQFIRLLRDFNYKMKSEYSLTHRAGKSGDQINLYNSTQALVIYDKISQIVSEGFTQAEEKIKKDVLSGLQKRNILRFEFSLKGRDALWDFIKNRFKDCKSPTLQNLFNPEMSKAIILEICSQVMHSGVARLLSFSKLKKDVIEEHLLNSGFTKINEVALWIYVVNLIQKIGVRQTYQKIETLYGKKSAEYIKQKIKKLPALKNNLELGETNIIKFLKSELEKFEPIKAPVKRLEYYINLSLKIS